MSELPPPPPANAAGAGAVVPDPPSATASTTAVPPGPAGAPPPPAAGAVAPVVVSGQRLSKWFGDVVAVSEVDFAITPGVTALLGPNGAGKSTALRMIAGLTAPSQGVVRVLGEDPRRNREVRGRIGLVPQQERLFSELRAIEFVTLAAQLNGLDDAQRAASNALEAVEMDPDETRPVSMYSKGMRQRVKVAQAIVHQPDLLLMDEPLTGLDPRQRVKMIELIRRLGASGVTVIVSSHVLDEVQRLGSRILVIAQGRLAAQGNFEDIRNLMDDRPHRIRIRTNNTRAMASALLTHVGVNNVTIVDDEELIVGTEDVERFRASVASLAVNNDLALREVHPLDDDLESVFKYLVGR